MSKVPQALKDVMGIEVADLLEEIRDFLAPNDYRDTVIVDLSVAHTDFQYEMPPQISINSLTVMPVPSAMSLKINSTADKVIELRVGETIVLAKQEIKRFYISNDAAAEKEARIHVFGKIGG
ncbi:hypothetical protein HQ586_00610 [Candidatus Bathyarchaeota archaeon]|nr:hypothetical protein [Candidatus Bathyarchaeota archaeon]